MNALDGKEAAADVLAESWALWTTRRRVHAEPESHERWVEISKMGLRSFSFVGPGDDEEGYRLVGRARALSRFVATLRSSARLLGKVWTPPRVWPASRLSEMMPLSVSHTEGVFRRSKGADFADTRLWGKIRNAQAALRGFPQSDLALDPSNPSGFQARVRTALLEVLDQAWSEQASAPPHPVVVRPGAHATGGFAAVPVADAGAGAEFLLGDAEFDLDTVFATPFSKRRRLHLSRGLLFRWYRSEVPTPRGDTLASSPRLDDSSRSSSSGSSSSSSSSSIVPGVRLAPSLPGASSRLSSPPASPPFEAHDVPLSRSPTGAASGGSASSSLGSLAVGGAPPPAPSACVAPPRGFFAMSMSSRKRIAVGIPRRLRRPGDSSSSDFDSPSSYEAPMAGPAAGLSNRRRRAIGLPELEVDTGSPPSEAPSD